LSQIDGQLKSDGSLVTEADLAMNRRLRDKLAHLYPDIGFLSEEMPVDQQESALSDPSVAFWCLDPLDGTTNFVAGVPLFAVSLALLQGGEALFGIICDPSRDECFSAEKGKGAFLNESRLVSKPTSLALKHAVAVVDFKRLSAELKSRLLRDAPYASQRNFGSCALEWGWIAAGRGHVCLHGGQKLWDYAAGTLLLAEAGGCSATLEGEAVFNPTGGPRSVVSSSSADLFAAWSGWLAQTSRPGSRER
jgi:myo-inositol-1(or 4)-monophosphatase